jgi:hypothetical protein
MPKNSYGFCLNQNKFDGLKVRVVVGTAPEGNIENPEDLLPTDKQLSDPDHLSTTTELLNLKPMKISSGNLTLNFQLSNNFVCRFNELLTISVDE